MAEIKQFKPAQVQSNERANEATVKILEELLEMAKEGTVTQLICLSFSPDGCDGTYISPCLDSLKKIGGLRQLEFELLMARTYG